MKSSETLKTINNYQLTDTGKLYKKNGKEIKQSRGLVVNGETTSKNSLMYKHFGGYKPEVIDGEEFKAFDKTYLISSQGQGG